ncbi:MAG: hypothetical protein ACRDZ4_20970 [Egibacteraceae bacterium]
MPVFKIVGQPAVIWLPLARLVSMESAPGGLTTNVRALLATPKGEAIGTFEVEGRCEVLAAALDSGKPTEVGQ